MTAIKRPLCAAVCGLIAALLLGDACALPVWVCLLAGAVCMAALMLLWHGAPRGRAVGYALPVLAGLLTGFIWWTVYSAVFYAPAAALAGQGRTAQMEVLGFSEVYEDTVRTEVRLRRFGTQAVSVRAFLYLDAADELLFAPGDKVACFVRTALPASGDTFDALRYRRAQGVYLYLYAAPGAEVTPAARLPVTAWPAYAARTFMARLASILPPDEAGLCAALILGERSGLSAEYDRALRDTGLSHLTAVSGMNVSFLVGVLLFVFRRRLGMVLSVPAIIFFVLMTGGTASVVRAAVMQLLWMLSFAVQREPDTPTSLFFAVGVMLLYNPYMIADGGLWLSFFATLGLVTASAALERAAGARLARIRWAWLRRCAQGIASALACTAAAQIFVLPVQVLLFGELSPIALLSNLLAGWAAQGAFFAALGAAAISPLLPEHTQLVVLPVRALCGYLLRLVPALASIPYAAVPVSSVYAYIGLFCAYAWGGTAVFLRTRARGGDSARRLIRRTACLLIPVLCLCTVLDTADRDRAVVIQILHTAGGGAVLTAGRESAVVGVKDASRAVLSALRAEGQYEVSVAVLTDYRESAVRGVISMLAGMPVRRLLLPMPVTEAQRAQAQMLLAYAASAGTEAGFAQGDMHLQAGGIYLRILRNNAPGFDAGRLCVYAGTPNTQILLPGAISPDNLLCLGVRADVPLPGAAAAGSYYSSRVLPAGIVGDGAPVFLTGYQPGASDAVRSALRARGQPAFDTSETGDVVLRLRLP